MESLTGVIEHVIFHNPDNGFTVLRVLNSQDGMQATVVGDLPSAVEGEHIDAKGEWVQNRDHGLQFKVEQMNSTPPVTREGIIKYLGSGVIRGIGSKNARKIVELFGERTLAVIDENPAFLREVKGFGAKRVAMVRESWREQKAVREILMFLQAHGIGVAKATRIYKQYGERAIQIVRDNPYRLATDIWGIGFQTADEIAEKLGIDRASPLRARAALRYVLKTLSEDGHCGFPEAGVVEKTVELIQVDQDIVTAAVEYLRQKGDIIRERWSSDDPTQPEGEWLYSKALHQAETGVAESIHLLAQGRHPLKGIKLDVALEWVEKKIHLTLAPTQRDAICQAVTNKLLIITGGPGVGKTTIVRGILEIFAAKNLKCELCAPTGRAAKRLSETTGQGARTIHRLLEFEAALAQFNRNAENPLETDLLIVDETSMVDISLMHNLLQAVPPTACVVLVGDVDQLPSVGPGTVLADLINSGVVPVARLTEIFRQAGHSAIVRAAHAVNHGKLPVSATMEEPGDYYFVPAETPEAVTAKVVELVCRRIPARFGLNSVQDIQVLTPMNKTDLGARSLNAKLQETLNPPSDAAELDRPGCKFRRGDKVMQIINNYKKDVFNGDLGRIVDIDLDEQEMKVLYDNREVEYEFKELDELMLAYSTTIHKSQGSEYPAVVIPLHTQHFVMLQRNLLYTAITRGKKLVVVVGMPRALELAVKRRNTAQRCTGLRQRLAAQGSKHFA